MIMSVEEILFDAEERMEKALAKLKQDLTGIRTGRANPGMVDSLRVEAYGSPVPIKQIASVSAPEPQQLVIRPFDPGTIKDIEKGIIASDLGLAPQSDGKVIRLNIPPLSGEVRRKMVARTKELAEETKVAVRNIRRDANKQAEQEQKDKTTHRRRRSNRHQGRGAKAHQEIRGPRQRPGEGQRIRSHGRVNPGSSVAVDLSQCLRSVNEGRIQYDFTSITGTMIRSSCSRWSHRCRVSFMRSLSRHNDLPLWRNILHLQFHGQSSYSNDGLKSIGLEFDGERLQRVKSGFRVLGAQSEPLHAGVVFEFLRGCAQQAIDLSRAGVAHGHELCEHEWSADALLRQLQSPVHSNANQLTLRW